MKIDANSKKFLLQNAKALIDLALNEEDLSYNDLGGYISRILCAKSSLEIIANGLKQNRETLTNNSKR